MKKIHLLFLLYLSVISPTNADFKDGLDEYSKGNFVAAFKEWHLLANKGDANAQNNLGVMYQNGQGILQEYKEAVKWYTKASEQGVASAQYNLAPHWLATS